MPDHRLDLDHLGKKITDLSDALAKLGTDGDFQRLLKIIHFPGWTTPAEFAFASAIIDHMTVQVRGFADLKGQLMKASEAVGRQQGG
jgi:hypothetical protein